MSKQQSATVETAEAKPGCAPVTGSANDPISQYNAVRGLVEFGKTVEAWRADVKRSEQKLLSKMSNNTSTIEKFGWFYRPSEPSHVIALCAGHKYLAGRGWKTGEGSLAPLPPADLCCVCMGTATIARMRGAPLSPNDQALPQGGAKETQE